uniref:Cytochrome P450 3194A1 n=1 Tax=Chamberlinius hualienensis TaxID=1551368 RepID=A0A1J1E8U4_9MYRI|nr:cytochrome P450 3194A1 [Chamberlinius hualienensis]
MNVLGLLNIPDWLTVVAVVIALLYIYGTWTFGFWESQNVPTLPPYPLIGSMVKAFSETVADYDLQNFKKYGKTYGYYEFRRPYLMIHDFEMTKAILIKDYNHFPDRRNVPLGGKSRLAKNFLVHLRGDEYKSARAVLTPTFTSGKLKQMLGMMDECAQKMLKTLNDDITKSDGKIDMNIKDRFGSFTLDVIASCCFSTNIDSKNQNDPFIEHAKMFFNFDFSVAVVGRFLFPKLVELLELSLYPAKCLSYFENVIHRVVDLRRSQNKRRNDFLQLLLDAQDKEKEEKTSDELNKSNTNTHQTIKDGPLKTHKVLNESGLVANSILFLVAGFDTTANAISFTTYELALNPECQQKLHDEIDETLKIHGKLSPEIILALPYLDMTLSETLRMFSPATRLERECTSSYQLENIYIPKGTMVSIGVHAIHHDPEIYPEPHKFDPERFTPENKSQRHPMAYLPFGAGPRSCIGMRFALMEAKICLAHFFSQYKVSPCSETEIPILMRKGIPMQIPKNGIKLKVETRST